MAWRAGLASAGQELFKRNYGLVERFLYNKVGPGPVVDLVQETFVGCLEGRDRIRDDDHFRAYLLGIAYRVFCKYVTRVHARSQTVEADSLTMASLEPGPSTMLEHTREQRLLLEGLRNIPLKYQVVLELHYWERLSTIEIADALGLPSGTVRGQLQRARDALEAAMASISRSRELLDSTLTRLDDWAARCGETLIRMPRAS